VQGLAALPEGCSVDWWFEPLGIPEPPASLPGELTLQPVPAGFRAPPVPGPERQALDEAIVHRWEAQWVAIGALSASGRFPSEQVERAARLIESASCEPGRAGLRFRARRRWPFGAPPRMRISETELSSFLPSPWSSVPYRRDMGGRSDRLVLPLGSTPNGPGLRLDPGQGRHLLILGETGMGKSTLLLDLARHAARLGSVVVFDPLGDSARRFVTSLAPAEQERAVVIAPVSSPVGINAVPSVAARPARGAAWAERTRDDLVGALRRVRSSRYEESAFWGPRLDEMATMAIEASSRLPGGTLVEAQRLLEELGHRTGSTPPEARAAVEELRRRVLDRPDEVDGTRRLFGEITRNSLLRRMLCEPRPRWEVAESIVPNRIVVLSGEAPQAGESVARSLLAVHLALLWAEVIARDRPTKIFLVLDEVQWYAHESLGEMLRLGRRFNLHVWVATQSLSRLPEVLKDALLTNSADVVVFRGSPDEARDFARWSTLLRSDDIGGLAPGQAVVFLDKGREVRRLDGFRPARPGPQATDAWENAVARSERWVVPPDLPRSGPIPPTSAGSGPIEQDPLRDLVLVLWAGLLSVDPAETVRVPLAELRRAMDPGGQRVRELGRRLTDAGVRRETGRDDTGSYWTVRRDGFELLLPGGVDTAELTEAHARWCSLGDDARRVSTKERLG